MMNPPETLAQHLVDPRYRRRRPEAELGALLSGVAQAAVQLSREVRRAVLAGHVGVTGERNVTGDVQKKLDRLGNEVMLDAIRATRLVAAVVSEELDDAQPVAGPTGRYILCTDPLDGSSNTDVNGTVGTIFGVYRRPRPGPIDPSGDLLRMGAEQVLAGYVMYGPSTILVYTDGHGSHGFTLDLDRHAFVLSHPEIRCPSRGPYYSANLARRAEWDATVQAFVDALSQPDVASTGGSGRTWSLRYTGALVADLHRSLVEGGIYFYPADRGHQHGKLRLLYECAPLAFVVEQAGGAASTGVQRVLDIRADSIHQRVPFAIGSREDVALYERFAKAGSLA